MSEVFDRAFAPEGGGNSEAGKQVVRRALDVYRQWQIERENS